MSQLVGSTSKETLFHFSYFFFGLKFGHIVGRILNAFSVHLIFLLKKFDNCIVMFVAKKSRPVNKKFFKNVFRILDRKVAENFVEMKGEISCETKDA